MWYGRETLAGTEMIDGIEEPFTLHINQSNWYEVDATKITSVKDIAELLAGLSMKICEDYDNFDKVKHFLIIPEEPKSLEQIEEELNEKLNKIIETFKEKSKQSQQYAEYRYNQFCERQKYDFEYAVKNESFPHKLSFTIGDGLSVNSGSVMGHPSYELRTTNTNPVGYWSIKPYIKVYLSTKPNRIVRYFSRLLLDFNWKDV